MEVRCPKHKPISTSNILFFKAAFHTSWKVVSHPFWTEYFLVLCKRWGFPCSLTFMIFPSFLLFPRDCWRKIAQTVYSSFAGIWSVCSMQEFYWGLFGRCVPAPGSLLLAAGGVFFPVHVPSAIPWTFPLTLSTEVPKRASNWPE